MLCALENYYWRYTSASELVNMILAFVETRAFQLFQNPEFLTLSESMVQMIMNRGLEVVEIKKFEAMLKWAKHRIKTKSSDVDANLEFKCIMERLSRDLKLYRITPQELIRIYMLFLPSNKKKRTWINITVEGENLIISVNFFSDCFTVKIDKKRKNTRDSDVPSDIWNLQKCRRLSRGLSESN